MANNELVWSLPDGSYISKERYDIIRVSYGLFRKPNECEIELWDKVERKSVAHYANCAASDVQKVLNEEVDKSKRPGAVFAKTSDGWTVHNVTIPDPNVPTEYWSDWFDWDGRTQPVPNDTMVQIRCRDDHVMEGKATANIFRWDHHQTEDDIVAFRYATDNEDNWIKRPNTFIPHDFFWSDHCPVGLEWKLRDALHSRIKLSPQAWNTHPYAQFIRLYKREVKPKLPTLPRGWCIDEDGDLCYKDAVVCTKYQASIHLMRAHTAGALSTYLDWVSSDN